jgi:hypothetical protein
MGDSLTQFRAVPDRTQRAVGYLIFDSRAVRICSMSQSQPQPNLVVKNGSHQPIKPKVDHCRLPMNENIKRVDLSDGGLLLLTLLGKYR